MRPVSLFRKLTSLGNDFDVSPPLLPTASPFDEPMIRCRIAPSRTSHRIGRSRVSGSKPLHCSLEVLLIHIFHPSGVRVTSSLDTVRPIYPLLPSINHRPDLSSLEMSATRATHWECCHCHNVWSFALYKACILCDHHRDKTGKAVVIQPRKPKYYSAPAPGRGNASPSALQPQSGHVSRHVTNQSTTATLLGTNIFNCCKCGDGPMVWQNHRQCIHCSHTACRGCKWSG